MCARRDQGSPWRSRISVHSRDGSTENVSSGVESATIQIPSAISARSWPGAQPACPRNIRWRRPGSGASPRKSRVATPLDDPWCSTRQMKPSCRTGPPRNTTRGSGEVVSQSEMTVSSGLEGGAGSLMITPTVPDSSSWARTTTTARSKLRSSMAGWATSRTPGLRGASCGTMLA